MTRLRWAGLTMIVGIAVAGMGIITGTHIATVLGGLGYIIGVFTLPDVNE